MAARRQELYLQVTGGVSGLQAAMKGGKSLLADFGTSAVNVLDEVEKALGDVGKGGVPGLKAVEKSYADTFKRIGENARAAANAPTPAAAVGIIDANAAREAASAKTAEAAALRIVAEAATRADTATGGASAATRAYAVAAATAAVQAENEADALRQQAAVLGSVEEQLGTHSAGLKRNVAVSGQAKAGYQQLSYQLGDVATQYASGASASIIFAQQSGQVIQAISLISGEAKGLIGFLGGPWGIAIGAAVVALTPFVASLLASDDALADAIDKLKKDAAEAETAATAKDRFARSVEGVHAAIVDQNRALKESAAAEQDSAERANIDAKNRAEQAANIRKVTAARLADAIAARQALNESDFANTDPRAASIAKRDNEAQVVALQALLAKAEAKVITANETVNLTRVNLAADAAKRAVDPMAAIKKLYDDQALAAENAARKKAAAGQAVNVALTRELAGIERSRAAAIKAEQDKQSAARSTTSNRQFGREIDVAEATLIIAGIGGRVTSGQRSTEKQAALYADYLAGRHNGPVAKPGTSAHERGGAIDVAFGPGISIASIRKAFADAGVSLRKAFAEPGQRVFHVEFGKKGPSAESAARSAKVAADKAIQDADAYDSLISRAKAEQLQVQRTRVTNVAQLAQLDLAAIVQGEADLDRAAQKGVELGRWTQAQADAVKAVGRQTAEIKTATVIQAQVAQVLADQLAVEQSAIRNRIETLQVDADLATTSKQRRAIALKLLDLEEQQRRRAAQAIIDNPRSSDADRTQARGDLAAIDAQSAGRRKGVLRQTAGPLESYRDRLVETTGDMNEALESVAVRGFGAIEDAGSREIANLIKIKGVAGEVVSSIIADLARLAIQKAIVSAIGGSFFGLKDGGIIPGRADGGLVPGYADGGQPFVDAGMIRGRGDGRSDSILALVGGRRPIRVSNGEGIVNAAAVRRYWPIIDAMNKGQFEGFATGGLPAGRIPISYPSLRRAEDAAYGRRDQIELTGNFSVSPTKEFDVRMEGISARTVGGAAEPIMQGAQARTMRQLSRPTLPGGLG